MGWRAGIPRRWRIWAVSGGVGWIGAVVAAGDSPAAVSALPTHVLPGVVAEPAVTAATSAATSVAELQTLEQEWITSSFGHDVDNDVVNPLWHDFGGSGILIGNGANGVGDGTLDQAAGGAGGALFGDGGTGATDADGVGGVGERRPSRTAAPVVPGPTAGPAGPAVTADPMTVTVVPAATAARPAPPGRPAGRRGGR